MAPKRNYNQMLLPFDRAQLRKPILPPGLRDFATAHELPDDDIERLARAWGYVRVKPANDAEWRELNRVTNGFDGGDN